MNIIIKTCDIMDKANTLIESKIHFLNSKRNITMDGEFTKILFVTENFTTDSLFIEFQIQLQYNNFTVFTPGVNEKMQMKTDGSGDNINSNLTVSNRNHSFDLHLKTSKYDSVKKTGFVTSNHENQQTIHIFNELEKQLLNSYKKYKNIKKKSILLLNNHLLNGNVKFFSVKSDNSKKTPDYKNGYGIKISGIWESYDSVGITYKMMEVRTTDS